MGFAGSLHCIGMCSPLAMAATNFGGKAMLHRLIYNTGRTLMYGILGLIIGFVGWMLPLDNFQNLLSIFLGVALLAIAFGGISHFRIPYLASALHKISSFVKGRFSSFLKKKSLPSVFFLGALNGLLPCGLTFLALSYTLTLSDPVQSISFMILFGIGTLPAMLGFTSLFQWIIRKFHMSFKQLTTATLVISGCLLIARVILFPQMHSHEEQQVVDIVLCR